MTSPSVNHARKCSRIMVLAVIGLYTRERVLAEAGLEISDLRKAVDRDRETLDAVLPEKRVHKLDKDGVPYVEVTEGGAPDYDARLKASEHFYDLANVRKPPPVAPSLSVGGNLTVIRWDMTAPEIPPAGVRMAPRNGSSSGSNGSTSLSAIEDGERPPSR